MFYFHTLKLKVLIKLGQQEKIALKIIIHIYKKSDNYFNVICRKWGKKYKN